MVDSQIVKTSVNKRRERQLITWYCIHFRNYSHKSSCLGKTPSSGRGDRRGSPGSGCTGRFDFWGPSCKFHGCKACMRIHPGCSSVWWEGAAVTRHFRKQCCWETNKSPRIPILQNRE